MQKGNRRWENIFEGGGVSIDLENQKTKGFCDISTNHHIYDNSRIKSI